MIAQLVRSGPSGSPWPSAEDLLTLLAAHTGPRSQVRDAGLAWAAMRVFLTRSGFRLTMPRKDRMALTDALTSGEVDSAEELALRLSPYLEMLPD